MELKKQPIQLRIKNYELRIEENKPSATAERKDAKDYISQRRGENQMKL